MHDARVLRNTNLFRKAMNGDILRESVEIKFDFSGGDGEYPLISWLLMPYANNVALNPAQQHCNRKFYSARVVVEGAFGVLKGRWRILLKRMDSKFINVPST